MKKRDKISNLPTTKTKGYKLHSDGFGQQNNGDFAFSDDLEKHTKLILAPAIHDIRENYLNRAASKKWILCDYPENEMILKPKNKIKIPTALASLLNPATVEIIKSEWSKRYGI